jgi:hypothetical protein
MHPWTFYALELAHDRQREADEDRLAAEARAGMPSARSHVRRPAALLLAAVSRVSAAATRRLDECVADELGRALAPMRGNLR